MKQTFPKLFHFCLLLLDFDGVLDSSICLFFYLFFLLFQAVGWQLPVWAVTGSQTVFSDLLSDSQAALGVFCSHNALASKRSSREATKKKKKRKKPKAKWIVEE